jgi:alpha-glucosidase (family GH31 glycosyl hydrolase)
MKLLYQRISIVFLISIVFPVFMANAGSNPANRYDYVYHEMSGNKLFVYTDANVYSFCPYGHDMLRIGFHFAQDTTYPVSQSVVMQPEGSATLEETGNFLYYATGGFRVIIQKAPLYFSIVVDGDTIIRQGESLVSGDGSRMQFSTAPAAWYGGGSRAIPMNRAGRDLVMLNEPHYGYGWDSDQLNICIPMVVSSQGFALYFENASPGNLSLGSSFAGLINYEADYGPMSCFVIRSNDPDSLMKPYTELTGRQPLPPIWALGYIQSRFGYENETQASAVVNQMIAQGFPLDAIVFDLQWQGGVGEMGNLAWDLNRFPDPAAMMQDFQQKGVKSVCIADPYFTQNCQNFYFLAAVNHFAKNPDNASYILNDFWAGPAGLIDITNPSAANWYWQQCKSLIDGGVTGLWTDLGEPEDVPDDMHFVAGSSAMIRQTYNLRWSGIIYDHFRQDYQDRRLFNLTRSGYSGMQRYSAFPWSGDVQKTFGGLRSQIPIMLGMGLCGVGYMNADIGGFAGDFNPELYTRWQQMGVFVPVMRAHGSGVPTEPINYQEPYKSIVRDYIKLRYRMLPYNYTLAYENTTTGMPLVRPVFFEDSQLTGLDDEYLWGKDFLIAPVTEEGSASREVLFPQGKWIDFFNWTSYQGGQPYEINTPLDYLPVFVRAGAMIPMIPEIQHTEQYLADRYNIRYFPDPDERISTARIYIDDGLTQQAPVQNKFSLITLGADFLEDQAQINFVREGLGFEGEPLQKEMVFEIERTIAMPASVTYNTITVPITLDQQSYNSWPEAALFLTDQSQLLVKVQWDSQLAGLIQVDGLQITASFSIPEIQKPQLTVYPNPLRPGSQVNILLSKAGRYNFELFNSVGQSVGLYAADCNSQGNYRYFWQELFPGNFPAGTYILRIINPDRKSQFVKIIILN